MISFFSLIVGYGSYSLLNSTTESEQIKNLKNELEILDGKIQKEDSKKLDLKKDIKEITVRDFVEYQNLKDQKKKFEKANDVFGKVMMLFLAYLDLKQLKPEVDKFVAENNQLSVGEKGKSKSLSTLTKIHLNAPSALQKKNLRSFLKIKRYPYLNPKKKQIIFYSFEIN